MGRTVRTCRWVLPTLALLSLCGACAHQAPVPSSARDGRAEAELRAALAERDRTIQQLEGKLALLEASQAQMRAELDAARTFAPDEHAELPLGAKPSVRIGARKAASEAAAAHPAAQEDRDEDEIPAEPEPRPVLKLGDERRELTSSWPASSSRGVTSASWTPPHADERLQIAPLPALPAPNHARGSSAGLRAPPRSPVVSAAPIGTSSAPIAAQRAAQEPASSSDEPGERYMRALDLLRRREFPEALRELDAFVHSFPDDARCVRALFWRGEILFAQRSYAEALTAFEQVLARAPHGERAPEAWLRVARCHMRLGAPARARAAITKLKTDFPDSEAARLAEQMAQEDS